jgi:hypothetical protein
MAALTHDPAARREAAWSMNYHRRCPELMVGVVGGGGGAAVVGDRGGRGGGGPGGNWWRGRAAGREGGATPEVVNEDGGRCVEEELIGVEVVVWRSSSGRAITRRTKGIVRVAR